MRRRKLGQHYLVDQNIVRRIVEEAAIRPHEKVLEIGTGRGALSKALARQGKSFEGFELDRRNYEDTVAVVGGNAKIHLGDAFERKPDFDVLVASLPYSKSATFVEWLNLVVYDRAVVLLQEEFVRKIQAAPGTRDYRAISALAQISSEIKPLWRVGRTSFSPPPRVNSLAVSFTSKVRVPKSEVSKIKLLFSQRRRRVSSVLARLEVAQTQDYGTRRVYSLTPDEVHRLCSPTSTE
jgi:16S rRNA (adenine1518-N6/adenine1519-N6)-dimethyltransferase